MNAVEIEEAISILADQPFDPAEFPYAFLEAFGNKSTTIHRLRKGESNKTDIPGAADRRHDMNHFVARLIFCFFAEDTDIFRGDGLFTATVEQMSAKDSSNTHEVISEVFRAMNTGGT